MKSRQRKKALRKGYDTINYSIFRHTYPDLCERKPGARLTHRERKAIWADLREMHFSAVVLHDMIKGDEARQEYEDYANQAHMETLLEHRADLEYNAGGF